MLVLFSYRVSNLWHICVDTGGTFTDCLARDRQGGLHRAKVLSSSRLRGRITERLDDQRLRIDAPWIAMPGLLEGFSFRLLAPGRGDSPGQRGEVRRDEWVPIESHEDDVIVLTEAISDSAEGASFELTTGEPAPILAARLVTGTPAKNPLPTMTMRLATTRGTNALLERAGAETAFFITRGFRDLLHIGDQQRPDLFALNIQKRQPLHAHVIEVDERLNADGSVLRELDEDSIRKATRRLIERGVSVAAVALLHSYRNDEHEQRIAKILRDAGLTHISCSAALAPLIEILPRAETAVVDAYLSPVIESYLDEVQSAISNQSTDGRVPEADSRLHVMTSAGGLVEASRYHAKDSLLSGPAGGVAGAAAAGRASGYSRIIGFDMGGTSTDVARYADDFEYRFEHTVGGAKLVAPALAIETVAAGGGSICDYRDERLRVGPESAGADPGPACYGAGGPLTITDVNLLMGRLAPDQFEIPIDREASERALASVAKEIHRGGRRDRGGETGKCDENVTDADREEAGGNVGNSSSTLAALSASSAVDSSAVREHSELLDGFLAIANERMADAIAHISLRRGYDVDDYALVSFGGAGGQHACALAGKLGMKTVIMPRDASILSAVGLAEAVIERFGQKQVLERLDDVRDELAAWFDECADHAVSEVEQEGIARDEITVRRRIANLRLEGQDATLAIEVDSLDDMADAFAKRYADMYGHKPEGKPIEVESIRVVASSNSSEGQVNENVNPTACESTHDAEPIGMTRARFDGQWLDIPAYDRDGLEAGDTLTGPALIFDRRSSYVIENGWRVVIDDAGAIVASYDAEEFTAEDAEGAEKPEGASSSDSTNAETNERDNSSSSSSAISANSAVNQPEVARLELFTNRFSSIAEEMGQVLQRTALSTNVKRRLDFSCAVLDADGRLVVNAPHIPVHLGALGLCVRKVREQIDTRPGDVIVTNHPAYGGSHLPDITVITPVFEASAEMRVPESEDVEPTSAHDSTALGTRHPALAPSLIGYVASRAHHAEIGGSRPGSMPPMAKTLAEEGVVIPPMYLLEQGESRFDEVEKLLRDAEHPSRAVEDNLADLRAAVAANHRGARSLRDLAKQHGRDEIVHRMKQLRERAAKLAKQSLRDIDDGRYEATEKLDDGSPLAVTITIEGDRATIDFDGTADQHRGNLNATPAIVESAILYVLRLMIGERLPLNEGILEAVEIKLPRCLLNPTFDERDATKSPAVVGGNTETSQRLVDTLIKALKLSACSQGTMNNVLFGNERFGYYETVCGGAGATAETEGADAVHTHMTNTRITDIEIIEHRYPVRVERFEIRADSGGRGKHRGGHGVTREITFLEPIALSILSQHRVEKPYGLEGGEPGAHGKQEIHRENGEIITMKSIDQHDVQPDDKLILHTPGGGGYGPAEQPT
jgi:5-oxoprolinase (ATP-hydrolysing)